MAYPKLTAEELDGLKAFAAYAGRTWKAQLRAAWSKANMPGILHRLRNTHGPQWLKYYSFPQ